MTKDKRPGNDNRNINTDGGLIVDRDVNTGGGNFVGRDITDTGGGDVVKGNKITTHNYNLSILVVLLLVLYLIYLISSQHQTNTDTPTPTNVTPTNTPVVTEMFHLLNPAPITALPPIPLQPLPTPTITPLPPTDTPTSKPPSNFEITLTALENQQNTTPVPLQPLPTPINTTLLPIEMTLTALANIQNTPAPNTPEPPTNTNTPLPPIKTPTLIPISTETVIPANTATSTTAPTVEASATIGHTPPPNTPEQPTATQVATSAYILRLFDKTNGNSATDFQVDMVNTSCGLANIVGPGIFLLDETDLVQQVTNLKSGFKGAGLPEFLDLLKVYNDDAKVIGFLASSSEQLIVIQDKNLRLYLVEETVQQIPSLADLPITQNQEVMCIGDVNEVRSFQFILQALVGQYQLLLIQN